MKVFIYKEYRGIKSLNDFARLYKSYDARLFIEKNNHYYEIFLDENLFPMEEVEKSELQFWGDKIKETFHVIKLRNEPRELDFFSVIKQVINEHPEWLI